MEHLNISDYIVFFSLLAATFSASIFAYKKNKEDKAGLLDYLLMGRQLSLPLFVATLVSTWYGGIFGVTKIAFESGIYNFITQGFFWYITYILMAFVFVHKIKQFSALTLPDLIGELYGNKAKKLAAVFNFFNVVPIAYTISLGLFLQSLFGGEPIYWMFIGLLFVLCYSAVSGFRAIVYTDIIQFLIMTTAVALLLGVSIHQYGGFSYLQQQLPEKYFSFTSDHGLLATFTWGFIALSTLIDPNFYQRIFAAKSTKVAKNGVIVSTLIWVVFDLCTTFGAMYAKASMPALDSSTAYLEYALYTLPNGLKGFFLAGILATILSTMDSYLFIAGNTLSYDLSPKLFLKPIYHRLSLLIVGLLSIFLATVFDGNIKNVWKTLGSYSAGALLIPVIHGLFCKKRINENSFLFIVLTSSIAISLWRFLPENWFSFKIDDLYIGLLISLLGVYLSKKTDSTSLYSPTYSQIDEK